MISIILVKYSDLKLYTVGLRNEASFSYQFMIQNVYMFSLILLRSFATKNPTHFRSDFWNCYEEHLMGTNLRNLLLNSQHTIWMLRTCRAHKTHTLYLLIGSRISGDRIARTHFKWFHGSEELSWRWSSARVAAFEVDTKVVKKFASILVLYSVRRSAGSSAWRLSGDERRWWLVAKSIASSRWNCQRATSSWPRAEAEAGISKSSWILWRVGTSLIHESSGEFLCSIRYRIVSAFVLFSRFVDVCSDSGAMLQKAAQKLVQISAYWWCHLANLTAIRFNCRQLSAKCLPLISAG